jgi:hypothetical protein
MSRYSYELPDHKITYATLAVADLVIEPDAQRALNQRRVDKMADAMILTALGTIVVSKRTPTDKQYYVVDGMHRVAACKQKGVSHIYAEIHHEMSKAHEAILFLIKNRESTGPNPMDTYRIGLTAGMELFVDTQNILDKHALSIGSTSANSIGAVVSVTRITETYGPEILDRVLTVAEVAWGRTPAAWDGVLISGLGQFLGKHGDAVDDKLFADKLAKAGPATQWQGKVHQFVTATGTYGGSSGRTGAAYILFKDCWNKNKRPTTRIP